MILEAQQSFDLPYPGSPDQALAFLRDPVRALAHVHFLRGLHTAPDGVRGELLVALPLLGDADLPFCSALHHTPDGAALIPEALTGERAWVEVAGQSHAESGPDRTLLRYHFQFRAHLDLPPSEGWGGGAFEKMAQAAARRTLERVARELPAGIAAGIAAGG